MGRVQDAGNEEKEKKRRRARGEDRNEFTRFPSPSSASDAFDDGGGGGVRNSSAFPWQRDDNDGVTEAEFVRRRLISFFFFLRGRWGRPAISPSHMFRIYR